MAEQKERTAEQNEYGWLPLSKAKAGTVIPLSGVPGDPGRHCPMHTALALAKQLGSLSTLVVGTAECGYYSRYVMTEPQGRNGELHYVYELDANEVVFGCRKGLMEAIQEMDREGAEIILLILTCVPALIGEDMEAVIEELQGKITAKLLFIDGAHFKHNGYLPGFLDTYSQLGEANKPANGSEEVQSSDKIQRVAEAQRSKEVLRSEVDCNTALYSNEQAITTDKDMPPKYVNFLGSIRGKEAAALKNNLVSSGYEILEINNQDIQNKMPRLWAGVATILLDPAQSQLSKILRKTEINLCRSFQAEEIRNNYRSLLESLGLEEEFLLKAYEELIEREEEARKRLQGFSFILTSQELLALPVAAYLGELGMEPKLLSVESFTEEDLPFRDRILKAGWNPYLVTITEEENIKNWGRSHSFISIGHSTAVETGRSLLNSQVQKIFALTGYERSISLLDSLMELEAGINYKLQKNNGCKDSNGNKEVEINEKLRLTFEKDLIDGGENNGII